jgi:hypothetical protein
MKKYLIPLSLLLLVYHIGYTRSGFKKGYVVFREGHIAYGIFKNQKVKIRSESVIFRKEHQEEGKQ